MSYGDGQELTRFETAMEATGLAWWWMELPSGIVFFSPNKAKMLGYKPDKFVHYTNFTELVHPDDYQPMMQAMRDHLEGKSAVYETKYRIKHKDGTYRKFYDRGQIVGKKDGQTLLAGFVFDTKQFSFK